MSAGRIEAGVKAGAVASLAIAAVLAIVCGLPQATPAPATARPGTSAAPAAPRCHFEPGDQAAFALESTVRDVRGEETDRFHGTLSWELVAQLSPRRWRLRAALSEVTLTQTLTRPEERITGPLTDAAFFVDVDAACSLVDFGFARQWDARRRRLVQSALAIHGFVLPPTGRSRSWSASQRDGLGSFEASYTIAPGTTPQELSVDRHKAAYDGQGGEAFGVSIVIVDAAATARFNRARPAWLRASVGHERVQILIQGELEADLEQRFRLVRDDARFAAIPPLSPEDADFRDPADLAIAHEQRIVAAQAGIPYEDALAAFHSHFTATDKDPSYAAARELAAWLKSHPEGARLLAEALRADTIAPAARPALFLGLELSGTDEARGTLGELLVDPKLRSVDRARAASALADLGEPTRSTAELLLAQASAPDPDPMVASVSVLGVGIMAKRGDEELRSYVRESLDQRLTAAIKDGEAHVLLDAMGNSGDPAFADTLGSHLAAENPATRKHAAQALGRLDPAEAGPRLLDRLAAEPDPAVSAAIVGAYHGPATATAIATIADKLEGSRSVAERAALIGWLGAASRREPAAQRRLVALARQETDARLLQQIGAYVPAAELR